MLTLLAADDIGPWWQSSAAAALAGVVVGALVKYLADLLTEGSRRKAEDERRFIDLRRENYVHLITRTDAVRTAYIELQSSDSARDDVLRIDRERGVDPFGPGPASPQFLKSDDRLIAAKSAVTDRKLAALETIDTMWLLAPKPIARQARACLDAAQDPYQVPLYGQVRASFIALCRVDLHVDDEKAAGDPVAADSDIPRPPGPGQPAA